MKIRIGLISRTFFNVPLWAALKEGFFERAGLEVEAEIMDSGSMVTQGMKDGSLHFALGPPDGVIMDVAGGGTLRVLAGNTSKLSHFLIAQPRFARIEDLKGAVIGCLSIDEGTTFVIQDMLARHGLEYPGDYTLDPVGGAPTRWKLFQEGGIDAGLQSIPLSYMADDAGFSNLAATVDYIPDYQFTTINAEAGWARRHAAETEGFLRALLEATAWMCANREAAAVIAAAEMRITEDYARRAWDDFTGRGIMPADMSVSAAGLAKVIDIMKRAGQLGDNASDDPETYMEPHYLDAARGA